MPSKEDRKKCKSRVVDIRESIDKLMKESTELKKFLLKQSKTSSDELRSSEGFFSKLTASSEANVRASAGDVASTTNKSGADDKIQVLVNRLEDLQENLSDLLHDFEKTTEIIVDREDLLNSKGRKLEDAKKEHEDADSNLFSL